MSERAREREREREREGERERSRDGTEPVSSEAVAGVGAVVGWN